MAISFDKVDIDVLVGLIRKAIDNKHIDTWEYDKDGDFTHTPSSAQWKNKAWLSPNSANSQFRIKGPKGGITREVYAVYQGRFIEMLIRHFPKQFGIAAATAMPTQHDCNVT